MLGRSMIVLAFVLLVAVTTAQDVVLHAKGVKPPAKPNNAKPARQGAQHPEANLQSVVMHIPDPSTRLVEEDQLGSFVKSGAPFKKRVNAREMVNYLEKVEATFDQIYYEQYLEELQAKIDQANSEGDMLEEGQYLPTIARPPTKALAFELTKTSPSYALTTSFYHPANVTAACGAWISLIRYCGTTETNTKSLSACYCTSGTDYVPDQWNSLAARCAMAEFKCKKSSDYLCDLTEHAWSSTDFCKTDTKTVKFHTESKAEVKPYTATADSTGGDSDGDDNRSMGCNEFNDPADCPEDQQSGGDSEPGGSSEDSAPAEQAAPQPKATSSAYQASATTSASPDSTRAAHTSHTSSSISWTTPSATSTSSAQSLGMALDGLVFRISGSWLLVICAPWLL